MDPVFSVKRYLCFSSEQGKYSRVGKVVLKTLIIRLRSVGRQFKSIHLSISSSERFCK